MIVLIVDDDPNTVSMIEDSVPWEEYGITEVYGAYHGEMALELIERHQPDIVFSDIEMPRMDGIRMLEILAEKKQPMPEVIFLTCHDDFTYAQKAMRFGAADYLLKPFRVEELIGVLTKMILKCRQKDDSRMLQKQLAEKNRQQEKNRDYLVQNFLYRLLNKTMEGDTQLLAAVTAKRNIPFDVEEKYYLVYAGINMNSMEMKKLSESEFYFVFRNLATEVICENINAASAVENTVHPYYILIMPVKESTCSQKNIEQRCQRLIDVTERYLEIQISCAISEPVLPMDFGEKKKKMDELFLRERAIRSKVILPEQEKARESVESGMVQEDVITYLKNRQKTELLVYLKRLLQKYDRENVLDADHMQAIHHDLMQIFYGYLFENHIQAYQLFQNETFRILHHDAEYSSVNMIKYVNYLFDCTFSQIDQLKESDTVIARVKKFIEKHFRENIGRDEIAASIYMTPNYLSKLFHEETGMALREYINMCRVEEAKKLLSTTNDNITDIAISVGFENIPYFSTVFKKYCSMTPAAWKNNLKNK